MSVGEIAIHFPIGGSVSEHSVEVKLGGALELISALLVQLVLPIKLFGLASAAHVIVVVSAARAAACRHAQRLPHSDDDFDRLPALPPPCPPDWDRDTYSLSRRERDREGDAACPQPLTPHPRSIKLLRASGVGG